MDFMKALEFGFQLLTAIKSFTVGSPAVMAFSFKGHIYKVTVERVAL